MKLRNYGATPFQMFPESSLSKSEVAFVQKDIIKEEPKPEPFDPKLEMQKNIGFAPRRKKKGLFTFSKKKMAKYDPSGAEFDSITERDLSDTDYVVSKLQAANDFIKKYSDEEFKNNSEIQREIKKRVSYIDYWNDVKDPSNDE